MRAHRLTVAAALVGTAGTASAGVNVEFRVLTPTPAHIGDTVDVGLYLVSDDLILARPVSAAEIVFAWDNPSLHLLGLDAAGGAPLSFQGFPAAGSNGLNETNPPADGDGLYIAFGAFGSPVLATPAGTLLTTFQFQALQFDPRADVLLPAAAGSPPRSTIVYDGVIPNTDITGTLTPTAVRIVSACGLADVDANGVLNIDDVNVFAQAFVAGQPLADMDANTVYNIDDINLFAQAFVAGCP